ncbi:hypothetical protein Q5752_004171 [Cryptotrichosporon argae]
MADVAMASPQPTRRAHLAKTFRAYGLELDAYNERRERLIILSRSITQLSKKLIFHLHRGATSSAAARAKNLTEGRGKEREIGATFGKIREELRGEKEGDKGDFWRFNRNVSPGLEEYIEAVSFLHYLETGELITLAQIQDGLSHEGEAYVVVTPEDYVLGMSDLSGELMRYATNCLSQGDHETPLAVCQFVRVVKTKFDGVPAHVLKKLAKKQEETTRSLEKIEKVCYALRLRLIEFGDKPEVLRQMAKRALEDAKDDGARDD